MTINTQAMNGNGHGPISNLDTHFEIPSNTESVAKAALAPTIVVGLGGTGVNTVRYLKQRLNSRLRPAARELIELLAVDTVPLQNGVDEEPLSESEYAYIGGYNASEIIRNLSNHREIAAWWPADREQLGAIHNGARQKRYIGRLSFFFRFNEFKTKFDSKYRKLTLFPYKEEAEKANYQVRHQDRHIYVVSSLCGGTGAGTFLDAALYIRSLYQEQARITGIFTLPTVIDHKLQSELQRQRIRANTYASLKELDYIMSSGREMEVEYPGYSTGPISRVFDRVFLLEGLDEKEDAVPGDQDIYDMIAQQIFIESGSAMNKRFFENEVNVSDEKHSRTRRMLCFSSFVTSNISLNTQLAARYAAANLTRTLVSQKFQGNLSSAELALFEAKIKRYLSDTTASLRDYAVQEDPARFVALVALKTSEAAQMISDWLIIWGYGPTSDALKRLFAMVKEYRKSCETQTKEWKDKIDSLKATNEIWEKEIEALFSRPSMSRAILSLIPSIRADQERTDEQNESERNNRQQWIAKNETEVKVHEREIKSLEIASYWIEEIVKKFEGLPEKLNNYSYRFVDQLNGLNETLQKMKLSVYNAQPVRRNALNQEICTEDYLDEYTARAEEDLLSRLYPAFLQKGFRGRYEKSGNDEVKKQNQLNYLARLTLAVGEKTYGLDSPDMADWLSRLFDLVLMEVRVHVQSEKVLDVLFNENRLKVSSQGLQDNAGEQERLRKNKQKYGQAWLEIEQLFNRTYPYSRLDRESGNSDNSFQEIKLIGVADTTDERLLEKLGPDNMKFELVDNNDPTCLEITYSRHGMSVDFLKELASYKNRYREFGLGVDDEKDPAKPDPAALTRGEFLHLARQWEKLPNLERKVESEDSHPDRIHFRPSRVAQPAPPTDGDHIPGFQNVGIGPTDPPSPDVKNNPAQG